MFSYDGRMSSYCSLRGRRNVTKDEARTLAKKVRDGLPLSYQQRLKAIHIAPRIHAGMTTIRVFTINQTMDDPAPYIFAVEELDPHSHPPLASHAFPRQA